MSRAQWITGLIGLLLAAALPGIGHLARRVPAGRCALDGVAIEPLYRVRVVDGAGGSHIFCGIRCARRWIDRQGERPRTVYVTDEAGGAEVDAGSAFFVQSGVLTNPITGNHIHVFRDRERAEEHARSFRGVLLTGANRPFGKDER